MKNIVAVLLALAIAALAGCGSMAQKANPSVSTSVQQPTQSVAKPVVDEDKQATVVPTSTASVAPAMVHVSPSSFSSLQPFKQFAKGAGHGMARVYRPRTKAEFVALMRNSKQLRVSCEQLVRQMAEIHTLPFENCEGAAMEIEKNNDYTVVACRDEMFQRDNKLTVTNSNGSSFGVWTRKCLAGETVLVHKTQPIASTMCANVVIPMSRSAPPAPTPTTVPTVAGVCPSGRSLTANAWLESSLSAVLHEKFTKLVAVANSRDTQQATNATGYKGDGVSRTLGGQLRREVRTRAPVTTDVLVVLRDPQTFVAVQAREVIRLKDGVGTMTLSGDQVRMIVETIWPANFTSPTLSGGERRLWLFPSEWGNWCTMNVHGLVQ